MFAALAASLEAQVAPDGVELLYIVCENGAESPVVRSRVSAMALATERYSHYILEPRLGIPFARNAVMNSALELGATHLAFIDDDETAPPDWISRLYSGLIASGAGLAGGPVFSEVDDGLSLSFWQRRVAQGMALEEVRQQKKFRSLVAAGQAARIGIATSNWLCDLKLPMLSGLRFREEIGLGGGSDTAFWHDFKALAGESVWVPDAPVFETLPQSRLQPSYIVRRAKSKAAAEWERRVRSNGNYGRARGALFILGQGVGGMINLVIGSFLSPVLFYRGLLAMGRAVGRLGALTKGYSTISLYKNVHGG
jgi:glycosyltransferase involved in cell wall biosynthesis